MPSRLARQLALTEPQASSPFARRTYDLRHAAADRTRPTRAAWLLDILEQPFDMGLVVPALATIREIGECFADLRRQLQLTLHESRLGVWELELTDVVGRQTIRRQYDHEAEARQAAELAYEYGRQFGRWKIQRAAGYVPDPQFPASPAGYEPVDPVDAVAS